MHRYFGNTIYRLYRKPLFSYNLPPYPSDKISVLVGVQCPADLLANEENVGDESILVCVVPWSEATIWTNGPVIGRKSASLRLNELTTNLCVSLYLRYELESFHFLEMLHWGGWGCEVSCGGHHRLRGKTTTGSALDGAVFDIAQILAYLVHDMSRSQSYLGFGHFGWFTFFPVNNILAGLWLNGISSV